MGKVIELKRKKPAPPMAEMECLEHFLAKAAGSARAWFHEARTWGTYMRVPILEHAGWHYLVGSPAPDGEQVELRLWTGHPDGTGREHVEERVDTLSVALWGDDGHLVFGCLDPCDDCDLNLYAIEYELAYAPGGVVEEFLRMHQKQHHAEV